MAAIPGEPALGPSAYMHRISAEDDNPMTPISHHWLDSTHITFGVADGGLHVHDDIKLEVSQFTGREPDQHRFDFDTARRSIPPPRASVYNPDGQLVAAGVHRLVEKSRTARAQIQ